MGKIVDCRLLGVGVHVWFGFDSLALVKYIIWRIVYNDVRRKKKKNENVVVIVH